MPQASLSVAPTPIHLPSANGRDCISRIGICGTHKFASSSTSRLA
jgi:hypothetical protein